VSLCERLSVEVALLLTILRFSRQFFATVSGYAGTCSSPLCALCLVMVLLIPVPLAASPADPLWIAGIYDGADFDETIEVLTSVIGIVEGLLPGPCNSLALIVRIIPSCDAAFPPPAALSPLSVRGPPTV
jgi:hypothetical protein